MRTFRIFPEVKMAVIDERISFQPTPEIDFMFPWEISISYPKLVKQ